MPTMAMQALNLGGMSRPQAAAACRSRCSVRTTAVVAAPPKTGLKTEQSEKVSLVCRIVHASYWCYLLSAAMLQAATPPVGCELFSKHRVPRGVRCCQTVQSHLT